MILWLACSATGSKIILINGVIALDSWGGCAKPFFHFIHLCRLYLRLLQKVKKGGHYPCNFWDTGVEYWGTSVIPHEMPRMGLDPFFGYTFSIQGRSQLMYSLDRKIGKESEEGMLLVSWRTFAPHPHLPLWLLISTLFYWFRLCSLLLPEGRQRASDCVDTLAEAILFSMTNVNWSGIRKGYSFMLSLGLAPSLIGLLWSHLILASQPVSRTLSSA